MDREAKEEYFVVIQAKDMGGHMGGLSGTTTVTITLTDVNDNPPKFAQSKCHYICIFCFIRMLYSTFCNCFQSRLFLIIILSGFVMQFKNM